MPTIPAITSAIKKTNLQPAPEEDPEFEVRITIDYSARVRAADEDSAVEQTWDQIMNEGAWGLEVTKQEDEDGTL